MGGKLQSIFFLQPRQIIYSAKLKDPNTGDMVWRVIFHPLRERIRSFIRSKTSPLTIDEAEERTAYYSKLYLMVASITLAVSAYYFNESIKSSDPDYKNLSPVEYYLKNMAKEKKVTVMSFSGISKTDEYVVDNRGSEAVKENKKDTN